MTKLMMFGGSAVSIAIDQIHALPHDLRCYGVLLERHTRALPSVAVSKRPTVQKADTDSAKGGDGRHQGVAQAAGGPSDFENDLVEVRWGPAVVLKLVPAHLRHFGLPHADDHRCFRLAEPPLRPSPYCLKGPIRSRSDDEFSRPDRDPRAAPPRV